MSTKYIEGDAYGAEEHSEDNQKILQELFASSDVEW